MAALAAERQGEMIALGIVFNNDAAGLHVVGDEALVDDLHFGDRVRLGEGGIGLGLVADHLVVEHIVLEARPDLRRAGFDRIADAGHRRQRLPGDVDRLQGIARELDRLGDDEGNGVADIAHLVLRQDRIFGRRERILGEVEQARQATELGDVVRDQHR